MTAFLYDALWSKSKVFVDRAIRARDNGDDVEFHLWATISLELLGKAALARIHPTLVADPNSFSSLLAACGRETSKETRSITAKTVFERVQTISRHFDERMRRECMLMANRRNSELHSGESPVEGLDPARWVPSFWRAANVLILEQEQNLEEWIGPAEAARVVAILADAAEVLRQTVLGRIERRRAEFNERYPQGSEERAEVAMRANARSLPARYLGIADADEEADCPACGLKGWLFGFECGEDVIDEDRDEFGYIQIVRVTYCAGEFRCLECGLVLDGSTEIANTELPEEFEREEQREPDYEPDYGNE